MAGGASHISTGARQISSLPHKFCVPTPTGTPQLGDRRRRPKKSVLRPISTMLENDACNMRLTCYNGCRLRHPARLKWNFRLLAPLFFETEFFYQGRGTDVDNSITQC